MTLLQAIVGLTNKALNSIGFEVRKKQPDCFLHEYASFDEYKNIQTFHNKRKIDNIWADEATLDLVIARVAQEFTDRPPSSHFVTVRGMVLNRTTSPLS